MGLRHVFRLRRRALLVVAVLALPPIVGCGDQNLWNRDFTKAEAAAPAQDVTGYWEGSIAMGGIRARIEPARITLALKCDKAGKILAQGGAPVAFKSDAPVRMTLLEDLKVDKDERCGFRFTKGEEFRYRLGDNGVLELDFAGSSVSRLRKLAD
jgi:hypothetical protein